MKEPRLEACIGCTGVFPMLENAATHRYMDSSAACWAAFNSLPELLEPSPWNALLVDAYAVHHPGVPSHQTINSVAIHLMVLHGIFEANFKPSQALWLRMRPGRPSRTAKHDRFLWLTPPSFASGLTIADVVNAVTPSQRTAILEQWIQGVWGVWKAPHGTQIAAWFERYVLSERL
jgi:hypothetical protein